jgi:L-type amino acid transporter 9
VAREMHNASKDLPRAIHSSMALVTMCYQLVNISFYILVSWDSFGKSRSVAVVRYPRLI